MRNRSFTLVQLIEDHAEDIASLAVRYIKQDPRLESMATIAPDELERRASNILRNLGDWLVATDPEVGSVAAWMQRSHLHEMKLILVNLVDEFDADAYSPSIVELLEPGHWLDS